MCLWQCHKNGKSLADDTSTFRLLKFNLCLIEYVIYAYARLKILEGRYIRFCLDLRLAYMSHFSAFLVICPNQAYTSDISTVDKSVCMQA